MPVDPNIRMLENCHDDPETMRTVAEVVLPRMVKYRKSLIEAARLNPVVNEDDEAEVEGWLTEAARVRIAVSRFIARYRAVLANKPGGE